MSKKEVVEIPTIESVPKIVKYDFASGVRKCSPEHIGVDIAGSPDIVQNLFNFPYAFAEDNSADEIHTSHFVEHVPMIYWNEGNEYTVIQKDENSVELFEKFIAECHRILKKGGKLTVIAPYYNSSRCWQDPTHRRAITEATFLYFNREWRKMNGLEHCHDSTTDFDFSYGYQMDQAISARNQEFQTWAVKHYTNSVLDIIVTLTKR